MLYCLFCAKRDTLNSLWEINKTKNSEKCSLWLTAPFLSLDSSCQVTSLVGKCGRPAALVCVYTLKTFLRPTPGPMPRCYVLCMDQSEGPTQPGVDDSCVTIGLRGRHTWGRLYLSFILMFRFFCVQLLFILFFIFFTAFQRLFILLRLAVNSVV